MGLQLLRVPTDPQTWAVFVAILGSILSHPESPRERKKKTQPDAPGTPPRSWHHHPTWCLRDDKGQNHRCTPKTPSSGFTKLIIIPKKYISLISRHNWERQTVTSDSWGSMEPRNSWIPSFTSCCTQRSGCCSMALVNSSGRLIRPKGWRVRGARKMRARYRRWIGKCKERNGQKVDSHFWYSWYGLDCSCRKRWLKLDKNDFGHRMQIRSGNIASQHLWSTPPCFFTSLSPKSYLAPWQPCTASAPVPHTAAPAAAPRFQPGATLQGHVPAGLGPHPNLVTQALKNSTCWCYRYLGRSAISLNIMPLSSKIILTNKTLQCKTQEKKLKKTKLKDQNSTNYSPEKLMSCSTFSTYVCAMAARHRRAFSASCGGASRSPRAVARPSPALKAAA